MKRILGLCLFLFTLCSAAGASAEEVFFYHVDAVGTPLAMTNAAAQKVWEADYKPFGEEYAITTSNEPNDRRFVGKEKDEETGLNYFGARYLSAGNGRFLAPDPVRAVDGRTGSVNYLILVDPQRINAYSYSLNNPYRYVDPDGKFGWVLIPVLEYGVPALITALSAKAVVDTNNALKSRHYNESNGNEISNGSGTQGTESGNDATFPDKTELAKKLGVKPTEIHPIKEEIKKDHPRELKKLNADNPDLGYTRDGTLVLKSRESGKTITTGSNINDYKRD